jgi:predicted ribosomally synthesized peptide with SipW-like signal peptide
VKYFLKYNSFQTKTEGKKMNVKKLAKGITVIALIAIIAVGATFAYLTNVTETKTNTFSSSKNITTTLTEDFKPEDGQNYIPGKEIHKAPVMTNTSTDEDVWIAVSVDYQNGAGTSMSQADFEKYCTINGWDTTDWTQIASGPNGQELYIYNSKVTPGAATNAIFTSVTVNTGISQVWKNGKTGSIVYTKDANGNLIDVQDNTSVVNTNTYYDATGKDITAEVIAAGGVESTLPTFNIVVKGYAVQGSGVEMTTAKTQLINLATTNYGITFTAK